MSDKTASLSDAVSAAVASKEAKAKPSLDDAVAEAIRRKSGDGTRADGTPKGGGFFGTLQRPDGRVSTELSIGVDFDGKETQIPLLVPSLTKREVDTLLSLGDKDKIPDSIADKAVEYAKLRQQAGKPPFAEPEEVGRYHPLPHEFKGERNREDVNVLGVPPELAAIGAGAIGRSVLAPGLSAAGRVAAGAGALASQAGPIVKYEAARHVLRSVGLPEPFASIGAAAATGGWKKAAPAEAEVATEAASTLPKGNAPTPLEVTGQARDTFRANQFPRPQPKLTLTAPEVALSRRLMDRGMSPDEIEFFIRLRRADPSALLASRTKSGK